MKRIISLFLCLLAWSSLKADVKLPALVGDNMVLQQSEPLRIWGWADKGEKITVAFLDQKKTTRADRRGKWEIILDPIVAGGPHRMQIVGKNTITLTNILVGEVWLASGQSNMEWPLNNINHSPKEISTATYPNIRLFHAHKDLSFQPKEDVISEGWKVCSPSTVERFSAVAYLFGRELHQTYDVPIGLIHSSWGGTTAEAWTSVSGLQELPRYAAEASRISGLSIGDFQAYKAAKYEWKQSRQFEDRGSSNWMRSDLNTSDWKVMRQPNIWYNTLELKNYGGILWLRKTIDFEPNNEQKQITLHLGQIKQADSVWFNGKFIGATGEQEINRSYVIPQKMIKKGRNLISLKIKGDGWSGGLTSGADELYLLKGEERISLAGEWLYQTGTDLSQMPRFEELDNLLEIMPRNPTLLYNAMIAPIIPFRIKGVIWYQGESNADNMKDAVQYYSLFPAMIRDWRRLWGYDFPFLFVQLANWRVDQPKPADYPWAHLREAQSMALKLPNTGMATTIDIGDVNDIHPRNKQDVGHRLALAARKVAYQENIVHSGPSFQKMEVEENKIRITFDHADSGLWVKDKYGYLKGFSIAGADQKFVWAKAYVVENEVVVYSEKVEAPIAVRYNWGNSPDGNLYNQESLPTVPFRTDDW